ncbi:TPA: plasmid recombination enzyme, partial [Streptococcus pyogenes]
DWDKTKKDFPDFEFAEHVQEVQDITGELNLFDKRNLKPNPRDYPRANNISFEKVFALLQEKFNQVREYIALKAHKMAYKVSELKNSINVLESKEEALEVEIGAKYDESEKLNELIKAKMDYTTELASQSELAVMLPDYVKPSKLNKDILLVPRDKWEAKHISANEISAYRRSMQFITRFEKEIQKTSPNAAKLLEKIEKQRQELSEQRDWSYKYFEKSKAQEKDLKFFRELRDKHTTDEEWDKIISRYDTAKAIEREMPSFDIDQSKGMSGPSL